MDIRTLLLVVPSFFQKAKVDEEDTFFRLGCSLCEDHEVSLSFFGVTEEQGFDEGSFKQFDFGLHLFHIEDGIMCMESILDLELVENFKSLFTVVDKRLLHDAAIKFV